MLELENSGCTYLIVNQFFVVLWSLIPLSLLLVVVVTSGFTSAVVPLVLISRTFLETRAFLEVFLIFYSNENWNRSATFSMVSILSIKLLLNRNSDGAETSLVRGTNFSDKILDEYCLLMLSSSRFAIPQNVKFSVQILISLHNWSLSSLPEMSLLFLRFIRLFMTSQMTFLHFQVFNAILYIYLLLSNLIIDFFHD